MYVGIRFIFRSGGRDGGGIVGRLTGAMGISYCSQLQVQGSDMYR